MALLFFNEMMPIISNANPNCSNHSFKIILFVDSIKEKVLGKSNNITS